MAIQLQPRGEVPRGEGERSRASGRDEKEERSVRGRTDCQRAVDGGLARDLTAGSVCALFTPDWKLDQIKAYAPGVAGKMRMMPLPIFETGDSPTSTWGAISVRAASPSICTAA